jgi:hypothetical protein
MTLFDNNGAPVEKFKQQLVNKGQQYTVVYLPGQNTHPSLNLPKKTN